MNDGSYRAVSTITREQAPKEAHLNIQSAFPRVSLERKVLLLSQNFWLQSFC